MQHFINNLINIFTPFFEHWGYPILFFFTFIEAVPLLGFFSPGATLVTLGGVLVKAGTLNLWYVLFFSIIGAWAGDVVMFIVGKVYGYDFLKTHGKYFLLNESRLEAVRSLITNHRVKTILFNRFSALTRPIGPFISGASRIPFFNYFVLTFISALLWGSTHVFVGILFGQGVEALSHYISLIFISIILLSVFIFYSYNFLNKNHQVFRKYNIYTLVANIASIFVFGSTLEDVLNHEWISRIDLSTLHFLPHITTSYMTTFMKLVTNIADPFFVLIASLLIIGYMIHKKSWYSALLSFLSLTTGLTLMYIIKALTEINRPLSPLVDTLYTSFPSGHATMITIFAILFAWAFDGAFKKSSSRKIFYGVMTFIVLLVGASRIYLRAHWVSDVLAGISLGVFSVTFYMLFLRGVIWSHEQLLHIFRRHIKPIE